MDIVSMIYTLLYFKLKKGKQYYMLYGVGVAINDGLMRVRSYARNGVRAGYFQEYEFNSQFRLYSKVLFTFFFAFGAW